MQVNNLETRLERLSWPEVAAALAAGKTTAIIVVASSEQHGPHLPEATDALIGEGLAVRLAQRLGNALVAPVIRPGCSSHHLDFPGTISITPELLLAIGRGTRAGNGSENRGRATAVRRQPLGDSHHPHQQWKPVGSYLGCHWLSLAVITRLGGPWWTLAKLSGRLWTPLKRF